MRRTLGILLALSCVVFLSSCSLLTSSRARSSTSSASSSRGSDPTTYDDPQKKSDAEMRKIADAVNTHNAAYLEVLISSTARAKIPNLGSAVNQFLSVFPSGHMTWKRDGSAEDGDSFTYHKTSEELFALYTLSESGKRYELYFADFTIHEVDPADYLGIYALGVSPYTADPNAADGTKTPFYSWASQFGNSHGKTTGTPGIFVPQ